MQLESVHTDIDDFQIEVGSAGDEKIHSIFPVTMMSVTDQEEE